MKKFFAILALVLVVAMCASFAVSAAAPKDTLTEAGYKTKSVTLTYNAATNDTSAVTSVDVTWDDVKFVYSAGTNKWNPTTHEYDIPNNNAAFTDDDAAVTVANHSNHGVDVTVEYTANTTTKVAATVSDNGSANLAAPEVGSAQSAAPSKTFTITASGAPTASGGTAGSIKVTIANAT